MTRKNRSRLVLKLIELRTVQAQLYFSEHRFTIRDHPDGPHLRTYAGKLRHLARLSEILRKTYQKPQI